MREGERGRDRERDGYLLITVLPIQYHMTTDQLVQRNTQAQHIPSIINTRVHTVDVNSLLLIIVHAYEQLVLTVLYV